MAPNGVVVFKILFLVLIAHLFLFMQAAHSHTSPLHTSEANKQTRLRQRLKSCTTSSSSSSISSERTSKECAKQEVHLSWRVAKQIGGPLSAVELRPQAKISEKPQGSRRPVSRVKRRAEAEQWSSGGQTPKAATTVDQLEESAELVADANGLTEAALQQTSPTDKPESVRRPPKETQNSAHQQESAGKHPPGSGPAEQAAVNAADLCFLTNGGSSLTLTVNEATPVGALIGTVDVNGDPALEGGNVELSVERDGGEQVSLGSSASSPAGHRQHRRLLGRRDTSSARSRPPTSAGDSMQSAAAAAVGRAPRQRQTGEPLARLERGTKNLILARQLDKESAEAAEQAASLSVLVRCKPRATVSSNASSLVQTAHKLQEQQRHTKLQQSAATTIPVRIIVTDANDHAPEFVAPPSSGALPYVVNISETAPVGSVATREILALDQDAAQGPHTTVHYRVLEQVGSQQEGDESGHSALAAAFAFTNPLEPTLFLSSPLDYETLAQTNQTSFLLTIQAQDEGEPEPLSSRAQVQVNVIDFDDQNPRFLDEKYTLLMDEQQSLSVGQNLPVQPRQLQAEDGDRGIMAPIVYSFDHSASSGSSRAPATSTSGADEAERRALLAEELQELAGDNNSSQPGQTSQQNIELDRYLHLNPTTGELRLIRQWPRARWPQVGWPLTLVVRATQADNKDRYALTTLTIATRASHSTHGRSNGSSLLGGQTGLPEGEPAESRSSGGSIGAGIAFVRPRLSVDVPEDSAPGTQVVRLEARAQSELAGGEWTNSSGTAADFHQQVDLVADLVGLQTQTQTRATGHRLGQVLPNSQGPHAKRAPVIKYQILDDQMDQFGISSAGELYLKRALDFELKQEHRIRVLATQENFSDLCYVHLNVLNVNDNKPKFTQAHYTFQLTESRLRSNSIGSVQAFDADLNDSIVYSLLFPPQSQAKWEQPSQSSHPLASQLQIGPSSGQLSLARPLASVWAANASSLQFLVQASDTLGPPEGRHKQQARVTLHVAPQIVGRSIRLDGLGASELEQSNHQVLVAPSQAGASSLLGGRNRLLLVHSQLGSPGELHPTSSESSTVIQAVHHQPASASQLDSLQQLPAAPDNHKLQGSPISGSNGGTGNSGQRSALATVVSSFQHMMRSVNFLEMPMSSALLLSALLAFLLCLLLIVVISMSVHVYKRRGKLTARRRHLSAAAHLRQQLAGTILPTSGRQWPLASGTGNVQRHQRQPHDSHQSASNSKQLLVDRQPRGHEHASSASSSPSGASLCSSGATRTLQSALNCSSALEAAPEVGASSQGEAAAPLEVKRAGLQQQLALRVSGLSGQLRAMERQTAGQWQSALEASVQTKAGELLGAKRASPAAQANRKGRPDSAGSLNTPLNSPLALSSLSSGCSSAQLANANGPQSLKGSSGGRSPFGPHLDELSCQKSSTSSRSESACSSVMNCGHYSVTNTMDKGRRPAGRAASRQEAEAAGQPRAASGAKLEARSSLEAAIRSLVRQERHEDQAARDETNERLAGSQQEAPTETARDQARREDSGRVGVAGQVHGATTRPKVRGAPGRLAQRQESSRRRHQLAEKLAGELADVSLDKPDAKSYRRLSLMSSLNKHSARVAPLSAQHYGQSQAQAHSPSDQRAGSGAPQGFTAGQEGGCSVEGQLSPRGQAIKWPSSALAQRVKRLTWDDELSIGSSVEPMLSSAPPEGEGRPPMEQQWPGGSPFADEQAYHTPENYLFAASGTFSQAGERADHTQRPSLGAGQVACGQTPALSTQPGSLLSNQNNCLDYTIVDNCSQFHVDSLSAAASQVAAVYGRLAAQQQQRHEQIQELQESDRKLEAPQLSAGDYIYLASQSNADHRRGQPRLSPSSKLSPSSRLSPSLAAGELDAAGASEGRQCQAEGAGSLGGCKVDSIDLSRAHEQWLSSRRPSAVL